MKRVVLFVAIIASVLMSCGKKDGEGTIDQTEHGVLMSGGTIWATRNVGEPGKFVAKPEDYGGYFTQEGALTACPEGWRLPTTAEFATIRENDEWTTLNGVNGYRFGNLRNDNKIFLPATGRKSSNGSIAERGAEGVYWSSSMSGGYNECLYFFSDYVGLGGSNEYIYGFSVRCVSEEQGEL